MKVMNKILWSKKGNRFAYRIDKMSFRKETSYREYDQNVINEINYISKF